MAPGRHPSPRWVAHRAHVFGAAGGGGRTRQSARLTPHPLDGLAGYPLRAVVTGCRLTSLLCFRGRCYRCDRLPLQVRGRVALPGCRVWVVGGVRNAGPGHTHADLTPTGSARRARDRCTAGPPGVHRSSVPVASGQLILRPYGWSSADAPDEATHSAVGSAMAAAMLAVNGETYTSQKSIELYATSGSANDWSVAGCLVYSALECMRPAIAIR